MEHVIRSCLIGLRLGEALGLDESQQAATYYVALLAWVGCHADAHERVMWFGDDIALKSDAYPIDLTGLRAAAFTVSHIGKGVPPLRRARLAGSFLVSGHREVEALDATHCQPARRSRAGGIGIDQKRHHHLGIVGSAAPAIGSAARVERGQVEHVDNLDHEASEMVFGEPLVDARRHQELLISVARDDVVAHGSSIRFAVVPLSRSGC
jgi:hypothetical protein